MVALPPHILLKQPSTTPVYQHILELTHSKWLLSTNTYRTFLNLHRLGINATEVAAPMRSHSRRLDQPSQLHPRPLSTFQHRDSVCIGTRPLWHGWKRNISDVATKMEPKLYAPLIKPKDFEKYVRYLIEEQ